MSVPTSALDRAVIVATRLEAQGFFEEVRKGDQKAASLFARLCAWDLNPSGDESDFGCLSKMPGETQVDGFAEDAICFGNNPNNRDNVLDLVNGAGAAQAKVANPPGVKQRREHNLWLKPQPLTTTQLLYLRPSGRPPEPPVPAFRLPSYAELGDDAFFRAMIGVPLEADYLMAGQRLNDGSAVWFSRATYRLMAAFFKANGQPIDAAGEVRTVRNEWRAILGLPPV